MTLQEFIKTNRDELDAAISNALTLHLCQCNHCRGDHISNGMSTCCRSCSCSRFQQATRAADLNDEERRQWILNDEGLYRWARSEGVRI
jgi:hypothetical protein